MEKTPGTSTHKRCILTAEKVVWCSKCLSGKGFLYFFLTLESSLKIWFVPRILSYAPYSLNNWFKTFLYSPRGFHFLKHSWQKLENQHIKHTFWQRKRWSDVFSVFPAMVFIFVFFGHRTHHWKLGLSHTFCSTRIKAWITGMKHSYTHSAFFHSLTYSWQTPKPSTHETHILPREEELWCSKRLSEYSYTHPALFHFFWHSGQTRKTRYKTCILIVEKALWCYSWFVGNCFCIYSWQWNHHWKYCLSDTFCSTHIKVSIIRFKHSYDHPLCSITFGKINNINWTSPHSTCILTGERWRAFWQGKGGLLL